MKLVFKKNKKLICFVGLSSMLILPLIKFPLNSTKKGKLLNLEATALLSQKAMQIDKTALLLNDDSKRNFDFSKKNGIRLNYKFIKKIRSLKSDIKSVNKQLREYLYSLENTTLWNEKLLNFKEMEQAIKVIKSISETEKNLVVFNNNQFSKINDNLFLDFEEVTLRFFSELAIYRDKLSEESIAFIKAYSEERKLKGAVKEIDSLHYLAKRVLHNLTSETKYPDMLINVNSTDKTSYDYDILFVAGLGSTAIKAWRMKDPECTKFQKIKNSLYSRKQYFKSYLEFLFFSRNELLHYLLFSIYDKMWIPRYLELVDFKDKAINYTLVNHETKVFKTDLASGNLRDLSIVDISSNLGKALEYTNFGGKPTVIVCHSMGGLIVKHYLINNKQNKKLMHNIKGVIFFSTPHYGSRVFMDIASKASEKYIKYFKIYDTSLHEYSLLEDDIIALKDDIKYSKATFEICLDSQEKFEKLHNDFRELNIPYVCINEQRLSYINEIDNFVHIVEPESSTLKEVENYVIRNTLHFDLQKFTSTSSEGYQIFRKYLDLFLVNQKS